MQREPIAAMGLLTQTHVNMLGPALRKVFPIPDGGGFDDLIAALDRQRSDAAPK
jgi:hypothetical protein